MYSLPGFKLQSGDYTTWPRRQGYFLTAFLCHWVYMYSNFGRNF
jgi:hypothetical protein